MDGHEPKFTIVKGLDTRLVLKLITETNEREDLTGVNEVLFFATDRPGGTPVINLAGDSDVDTGEVGVDILAADSENLTVGTYIAVFEMLFTTGVPARYTTERLYVEVVDRVGIDP